MPECFQRTPKQFNVPRSSKVLALTLDKKGKSSIHSRLTIDVHGAFLKKFTRSEVFFRGFFSSDNLSTVLTVQVSVRGYIF